MNHPSWNANRFKIGVFSANADGGLTLTRVPERWAAQWDAIARVACMADRAGLDFFLPIARWRGFGGEMNSRELSYETLTFAAGLAAITERITLFSTVHVPMVHPVFAAKALATIDHQSHGRAGLNIVCGWNPEEFGMFGLPPIEDRYAQGREWFEIVSRIHAGEAAFDYSGQFYELRNVTGKPLPVQRPRPLTVNAAFSPPGRDFAANAADALLTSFVDIPKGREQIADIRGRAARAGREVGVLATCHVVCRPTQAQAEAYYEHYAVAMEDTAGVDHHIGAKAKYSGSHEAEAYQLHRKRFAGGAGTYPLVGTARRIAEEMIRLAEAGFAGTTISFVNYESELPAFLDGVLPILKEAGWRAA